MSRVIFSLKIKKITIVHDTQVQKNRNVKLGVFFFLCFCWLILIKFSDYNIFKEIYRQREKNDLKEKVVEILAENHAFNFELINV